MRRSGRAPQTRQRDKGAVYVFFRANGVFSCKCVGLILFVSCRAWDEVGAFEEKIKDELAIDEDESDAEAGNQDTDSDNNSDQNGEDDDPEQTLDEQTAKPKRGRPKAKPKATTAPVRNPWEPCIICIEY
jgi:hypothetical protein